MKKICFVVCVLLLFSMLGCSQNAADITQQSIETTGAIVSKDPTIAATEPTILVTDPTLKEEQHDPLIHIRFDSIDEVRGFFSEDSTNSEGKNIFDYEPSDIAEKYVNALSEMYFPMMGTYISAKYYPHANVVRVIYVVEGIQYLFMYSFEPGSETDLGGVLAYSSVQIGPYTMELYKKEHKHLEGKYILYGILPMGDIDFKVRIFGDNYEEFSYEIFDYVPLS